MSSSPLPQKESIETAVLLKRGGSQSLQQRMEKYRVPGLSIAVMNDYQIEWAQGYGTRNQGEPAPVDTSTLFQACSISKAVTAVAVLRLVDEGRLDMDADVNSYLRSWKVPADGTWKPTVTIRQLLSHTAGISVPWFAGYHRQQDIPTLRQVLDGVQPSNTPEIRVTATPGTRFRYSGGGYCILQQLLIDVMGQPFPELMHDLLFKPLGMESSTFEQPLSPDLAKMAGAGHRENGQPVAGDWYVYPELAAAGLWTTPIDLALLGLELQHALAGDPGRLLSTAMVKEQLTPQSRGNEMGDIGLGIFVQGAGPTARFGHAGDNSGFTSLWIMLKQGGCGCVLMTNSDNGWPLQEELLHTIAQVYNWPDVPLGRAFSPREESRSTLELSSDEMRGMGYKVVDMLVEHFEQARDLPVTRMASRAEMEQRLGEPPPEQGTSIDALLQQVREDVFDNIMHLDSPRFFAFVPSPNNFAGVMAEALAAGFNPFTGTWLEASGPAQVELVAVDWLRQWCGLPERAGGLFVSGGSAANLTALATARHVRLRDNMQDAVIYFSDQAHSSNERAIRLMGFDETNLRRLPSNERYHLSIPELRRAISADREAGKTPFCVIANAGTVNTGAVDPLPELAIICREEGMWLHADGAYGAAAMLCKQGKTLLSGLELVDSLSIDPHKWLFQPYEIGCVLVRDREWLRETFHILPEYLQDIARDEEEINFCDYGLQLTRSFRALKLWMSLKLFGAAAFREAIAWGIHLAEYAETLLRSSSHWQVITQAQLGIITFRYMRKGLTDAQLDTLNAGLVDAMIADGYAMLSTTVLQGRTVLRFCTINPRATEQDIQETLRRLERFATKG
jgi:aromatic-L-amino-acid decarboxylase